jgi:prolyl 4-hydroxylase
MASSTDVAQPQVEIEIQELQLDEWEGSNRFAIVLHNVFTPEECLAWIERSEANGYGEALVNIGGGRQMKMDDFRSSARSIIDDPSLAEEMWKRIKTATKEDPRLLCPTWARARNGEEFKALGLNERLRYNAYYVLP